MTAGRQFALVSLGIIAIGVGLVVFSDRPKPPVPPPEKPATPPPPPVPVVATDAGMTMTVTAEGCADPTPVAARLCRFGNGTPLSIPLGAAAAAATDRHVYVLGGSLDVNGTRGSTEVFFAPIDDHGSVGQWRKTTPYPDPVMQQGVVAHGGFLYVVAGAIPTQTDNLVQSSVRFAKINADGSVGAWRDGPALPEPVGAGGVVVLNDFLYVMGGYSTTGPGTTSTGNVYFTAFKANGALAPWRKTTPLTGGRLFFAAAAGQGALYALGGAYRTGGQQGPFSDGSVPCDPSRVLIGRQQKDGTIPEWTRGTPFVDHSLAAGAAVVGSTLYLVQGRGNRQVHGSVELLSAPIGGDGSIGAWTVVGALPEEAASRAVAAGPHAIYAFGGTAVVGGRSVLLPVVDVIPFSGGALVCKGE